MCLLPSINDASVNFHFSIYHSSLYVILAWSFVMTPRLGILAFIYYYQAQNRSRLALTIFHALSSTDTVSYLYIISCSTWCGVPWKITHSTHFLLVSLSIEIFRALVRGSQHGHSTVHQIHSRTKTRRKRWKLRIAIRNPIPENMAVMIAVRWKYKWELKDAPSSYDVFIPPAGCSFALLLRCRP